MSSGAHPRPLRLIPLLAAAHLRHDWILTLCLVIALAAVIAPLLVLLGLKHGTIETLRDRLVEDPVFRELRPTQTRTYPNDWFAPWAERPEVAFVTPTILPLSSVLQIPHAGRTGGEVFDLIPTAAGDPLLLENGVGIPQGDQVVLTQEAARRLGVQAGAQITAQVTRSRGGQIERVDAPLEVIGVLPARAGSLPRIYAPLPLVLDVESYREGYASPARGWPGATPDPYYSFDGVVVLLPESLPPIERTGLIINTGFARIAELDAAGLEQRLGWLPAGDWSAYALWIPEASVPVSSLRAVSQRLRGWDAIVLPYVTEVVLHDPSGEVWRPLGLSLHPIHAERLGVPPTPWGAWEQEVAAASADGRLLQVWMPPAGGDSDTLRLRHLGQNPLDLQLRVQADAVFGQPVVPMELLAVLRTGQERALELDVAQQRLVMQRGGYRGFRMYARSIDDVPALYRELREQGVELQAEVAAIERIQVLDAALTRLFWLIAILGFGGGIAVLIASLYAAVERLRRDLGVLRLLGLARRHVFFFPVVQGVMIAGLGVVTALASYAVLAWAINQAFATELAEGERFAVLPGATVAWAIGLTLVLAALSSLVAAWRATHIDPAEAIRDQ